MALGGGVSTHRLFPKEVALRTTSPWELPSEPGQRSSGDSHLPLQLHLSWGPDDVLGSHPRHWLPRGQALTINVPVRTQPLSQHVWQFANTCPSLHSARVGL